MPSAAPPQPSAPSGAAHPASPITELLAVMARLRDPAAGCAWDLAQDFASIAPFTIEEAYEVADAIASGDMAALVDELGDLLLQVVFHSQIGADQGLFTFDDVARAVAAKMVRRHPHIFGPDASSQSTDSIKAAWEEIKQAERRAKSAAAPSAIDGVAIALPALIRAEKLQRRAARVGFDWPDTAGPRAKLAEELAEFDAAVTPGERADELGDLLFSAVNLARHHGVDPEAALTAANRKFERRFRAAEALAGGDLAGLPPETLEDHWRAVKASERTRPASGG